MLLTASSRPITMLSFPLRSNSWLSASTIKRAVRAVAGAAGAAAGADAAGAGAPSMLPQLEQKASPAGLIAPHDGQAWLPAGAGAGAAGVGEGAGAAVATGAAASGSPHSSQKAEPSGFSWPKEHFIVIVTS